MRPIEYPDLESIVHTYMPQRFLGKRIVWEGKLDGSNLMLWLDGEDVKVSSRHMEEASGDFVNTLKLAKEYDALLTCLRESQEKPVIFVEMLSQGKSPTRLTHHPEHKAIVIDVWGSKDKAFMGYVRKYQECYHFGLPCVEAVATCEVTSLESLLAFRDDILKRVEELNGKNRAENPNLVYEGVVLKTFLDDGEMLAAKEKFDTPQMEKLPHIHEEGKLRLPPLAESEVWGAVDKAFVDLGLEKFRDVRVAMPVVAKYVSDEARKHLSSPPKNIYDYYQKYLEGKLVPNREGEGP